MYFVSGKPFIMRPISFIKRMLMALETLSSRSMDKCALDFPSQLNGEYTTESLETVSSQAAAHGHPSTYTPQQAFRNAVHMATCHQLTIIQQYHDEEYIFKRQASICVFRQRFNHEDTTTRWFLLQMNIRQLNCQLDLKLRAGFVCRCYFNPLNI